MAGAAQLCNVALLLVLTVEFSEALNAGRSSAAFSQPLRLRGGEDEQSMSNTRLSYRQQLRSLNQHQIARLPWYILLEESVLALGDGPYGIPYKRDKPAIKNTEFEKDPRKAIGKTLYNACEGGATPKEVENLLKIGADPNFEHPNSKITCLQVASFYGYAKTAELLIRAGADTKQKGSANLLPIDIAKEQNHEETARVIEALGAASRQVKQQPNQKEQQKESAPAAAFIR